MSRLLYSSSLKKFRWQLSSFVSYVKLDSESLEVALQLHERYANGIAGGKRASLKFVDFSGIDLSGRNLAEAELTGCTFEDAKLIKTIFERAILFACDFRKADLRGARMAKADIRGANLRGADLSHADLTQSDFREGEVAVADKKNGMMVVKHRMRPGDAQDTIFVGATLDGSKFNGVQAKGADFQDCSMKGTNLTGAILKDCNLAGADLQDANLTGARLEGAHFEDAILTGVALGYSKIDPKMAKGSLGDPSDSAKFRALQLENMAHEHQAWWESSGSAGQHAKFDGEDLRPIAAIFKGMRLTALSAVKCNGVGVRFMSTQLQGANFSEADLRGACFAGADLRGANFTHARLKKADFRNAKLSPLRISTDTTKATDFTGAEIRYANFDQADIREAIFYDADMLGTSFRGAQATGAKRGRSPRAEGESDASSGDQAPAAADARANAA